MVLIVSYAHHGGHGDGEVPEIAVRPDRRTLVVGRGRIGKLVGGKFRGVHDVAFGVIGVCSDVPACCRRIPFHVVSCIDLKDISAASGFSHGGVDGNTVDAPNTGLFFVKEHRVSGFTWVGRAVVRVLFVPDGHGNAVS